MPIFKPTMFPSFQFFPLQEEIRMRSAISNSTAPMDCFTNNFPLNSQARITLIVLLPNGLCREIVSRAFLHALGIPSSLKCPLSRPDPFFLMAITRLVLSKILASLAPRLRHPRVSRHCGWMEPSCGAVLVLPGLPWT